MLVIRSPLEGDNYIRNNIASFDWQLFQELVSSDSLLNEEDFLTLQHIIANNEQTRYILLEDELFRFSAENELLYYVKWGETREGFKITKLDVHEG